MIANLNIPILEAAVARLETMAEKMAFVGGCATGLLLTDPAASPVRATLEWMLLSRWQPRPDTIGYQTNFAS